MCAQKNAELLFPEPRDNSLFFEHLNITQLKHIYYPPKSTLHRKITMKTTTSLATSLFLLFTSSCNAFTSPSSLKTIKKSAFVASPPSRSSHVKPLPAVDANFLTEAWSSYNVALDTNPLITKSITAGVILGAADFAGQALESKLKTDKGEEGSGDIDFARAFRFAIFGLILQAPWNHFYYLLLDGALPPTEDPFTTTTGIKVVIDQFVQAPIFTVLIFAFLGTLEGKSLEQVKTQLDNDYTDTMVANCKCYFL